MDVLYYTHTIEVVDFRAFRMCFVCFVCLFVWLLVCLLTESNIWVFWKNYSHPPRMTPIGTLFLAIYDLMVV